ncbi:MAG TPA: efflux transporter outer membrane subunit [Bryobacteraceae bacterium]|nr:efflux transporter outer membrane subunit [Bryobacteraceae bacterium]
MKRILATSFAILTLTSCAVGPNYQRPKVDPPAQFRGSDAPAGPDSLANTRWFDLFDDAVLKQLVTTALERNFDLRIAAERVLQARAQYGIERSAQFPSLDAAAEFSANRVSSAGSSTFIPRGTNLDVSYTQAAFSLGWELDLWGRVRRLKEAARAEYLATEEARHGVITTLISDVTGSYFTLRELDLELEIARKTRSLAEDSLRLTKVRHAQGAATGLDVRQAEQLLYTATAQIASTERAIGQTENALSLLLGGSPGDIPRGKALEDFKEPPQVPPGLPSALLERRPDIRQAERTLIAANARIGAARALYFPQISLTGFVGTASRSLTDLFTGPARNWNVTPGADLPVFNAGRVRSGVRFSEAQQREALIAYQRSIQTAFREVSDSLIGYRKTVEQRTQQGLLVEALRETERLSTLRYRGGLESYLQVLDAQRNLFQEELTLARLRQMELVSIVQLYRALGGGWS